MKKYKASMIGDLFSHKLTQKSSVFIGEVHSVFTNVLNISWNNELYTIGKAKIGNGPCTILLPILVEDLDQWGLKPGDQVKGDQRGIFLGQSVWIEYADADIWNSKWNHSKVDLDTSFILISWVKELIVREGDLTGFGALLKIWDDYAQLPYFQSLMINYRQEVLLKGASRAIQRLRDGLLKDPDFFKTGVRDLIGLGPGLTPAGDDFLIGLLLTFHFLESVGLFRGFKREFLDDLGISSVDFCNEIRVGTNLISAMGVLMAIKGRPFQLVSDVIQNIFSARRVETTLSVLRLIDRGTTSGTDILTGIVVGCDLFRERMRF